MRRFYVQTPHCSTLYAAIACALMLTSCYRCAHAEMRFISTVEAPTNYYQGDLFTGTSTEVVKTIRDHLGWTNRIEVYPWQRSYQTALNTPNCVLFTAAKTTAREKAGFTFVGPITTRRHAIFTRRNHLPGDTVQAPISHKAHGAVAAMIGDWRALQLKSEGLDVFEVPDHGQGLRMLMKERVDYWVSSDLEAPIIAKQMGYNIDDLVMVRLIKEAPSFMALSPGTKPKLIQHWQKAFNNLQQGQYFTEQAKYWSRSLNMKLKYSPTTGYVSQH